MTCNHSEKSMDVDDHEEANGQAPESRLNGLHLYPVSPQEEGQGLPYAPVNWPNPGDTWAWRVGNRIGVSGYYHDRYLYPPSSLRASRGKGGLSSRQSVKQYIRAKFPGADVKAFFASFSWRIPSEKVSVLKDDHYSSNISEEMIEQSASDSQDTKPSCKAGNRLCPSLSEEEKASPTVSASMFCDICCSETDFCRDCCCILCCKTISLDFRGYTFIKCQAIGQDDLICGHVAHLVCALRSYMAGSVGGSIGLDAEYYCMRCDARTQLVEHVSRILQFCESIQSRDDIKKMLDLGICLLRGSRKKNARCLLGRTQSALRKLEAGAVLSDVWKIEDDEEIAPDVEDDKEIVNTGPEDEGISGSERSKDAGAFEYQNKHNVIEEEINEALRGLRSAQQYEYKLAQEKLISQRDKLFHLYRQLEKKKSRLVNCTCSKDQAALKSAVVRTEARIQRGEKKLKGMRKVAVGFGKTPRYILKKCFDMDVEEN